MLAPAGAPAPRSLSGTLRGRTSIECAWGGIRAWQIELEPQETTVGALREHVVTLNLGDESTSDSNFEGRGWRSHRTPHHGVGVYPALLSWAAREHQTRQCLIVELAPEFVDAVVGHLGRNVALRPVIGADDPFTRYVLLALAEEARMGEASSALKVESLGTALVAQLVDRELRSTIEHVSALPSPRLRRVLDYISTHLDGPLTLRTLAGLAGMDVFRFIRAFKQSTGFSPHRYVLEARINRAKELLRNRELSITEIALETGFATPSHFSVTFRRITNETPRAYRDALG